MRALVDGMLAVLLAPACAACHASLDEPTRGPVCEACWAAVVPMAPPVCERCGDSLPSWRVLSRAGACCARCRRRPPVIAISRAVGPYEGALRAVIHALKYDGRQSVAARLGALMAERGADVLPGADVCVPVPLHPLRRWSRGFNQASVLARHLGPPVEQALRRTRHTTTQADLPAARRHANVRGAFSLAHRAAIGDRIVVLVDDVSTTGATLEACARVLMDEGAREVRALTAARAVSKRP